MVVDSNGPDITNMRSIHQNFVTNLQTLKLFLNNLSPIAVKHDTLSVAKIQRITKKLMKICGVSETDLNKPAETGQTGIRLTKRKKTKFFPY